MPSYTLGGVEVYVHNCHACGILYGVPAEYDRARREDGKGFHCPNGHRLVYRETEAARLRRELEREQMCCRRQRSRADTLENRLRAQRGATTRLRRRLYPEEADAS